MPQALRPPAEIAFLQRIPSVYGVTPQLTGFAEIVGRNTGNHVRPFIFVQFKQFRVHPDIRTVVRQVNRYIADNLNVLLTAVVSQI